MIRRQADAKKVLKAVSSWMRVKSEKATLEEIKVRCFVLIVSLRVETSPVFLCHVSVTNFFLDFVSHLLLLSVLFFIQNIEIWGAGAKTDVE
jgi:hypothetical protein